MKVELNEFERDVLRMLLDGDHPAFAALRLQVQQARVVDRTWTGAGFYTTLAVAPGVPPAPLADRILVCDVVAESPELKYGAGFVLYLDDGVVSCLEGNCYGEAWSSELRDYTLRYERGPTPPYRE